MLLIAANPEIEQKYQELVTNETQARQAYFKSIGTPLERRVQRMWNICLRRKLQLEGDWPLDVPVDQFPDADRPKFRYDIGRKPSESPVEIEMEEVAYV